MIVFFYSTKKKKKKKRRSRCLLPVVSLPVGFGSPCFDFSKKKRTEKKKKKTTKQFRNLRCTKIAIGPWKKKKKDKKLRVLFLIVICLIFCWQVS